MPDLPYRIVVGLETHVQLLTRTKLFCGCSTEFGLPPNSATCPVCIGMPGVLPVMNRRAFQLALRAATALHCHIAAFTKWDRKNYYYPDLPKNYQISQYDLPFSADGYLDIPSAEGALRRIGIIRVHLEEDAGKMLHDEKGTPTSLSPGGRGAGVRGESLVDLNRAGTPLLEIVSQPDIATPEEAKAYLEELRLLLRELGVSDCEMQEGSLRCDANVNIHIPVASGGADHVATPLVEVKNLNSFRGVERAIRYEAERQYAEYGSKIGFGTEWRRLGKPKPFPRLGRVVDPVAEVKDGQYREVPKATAGWNDDRGVTVVQRHKEEAADYRYFPDPDLVPVVVTAAEQEEVRAGLGELPAAQRQRLQSQYGLSAYDAGVLSSQGRAFVAYFEEAAKVGGDAVEAKNWTTNEVLQTLNDRKLGIGDFPITAAHLGGLIREVKSTGLNKQRAREVYAAMLDGLSAPEAVAKLGIQVVADAGQLLEIVRRAIAANPKAAADFKKGKTKAADAIKGAVMRETKGMAKMETVQRLVMEELGKE